MLFVPLSHRWFTRSLIFAICSTLTSWSTLASAQEAPAPAVIALRIDLQSLLNNSIIKPLQADVEQNLDPTQAELLAKAKRLSSVSAQIAAPEELSEAAISYTDFMITLNFTSAEAAEEEYKSLAGFQDGSIDGKTYKQTGGEFGMPLVLARVREKSIDIGSKNYITSGKTNFATPGLVAAYRALPKSAIRVAADLESVKPLVGQAVDMLQATADPFTKELIRPLRDLKTVRVHLDLNSDDMMGITAETFTADQAAGIKAKLDNLLGLGRNMLKDAPDDAMKVLAETMLTITKTDLNETRAGLQISKPAGFDKQFQQIVTDAQKAAREAAQRMQRANSMKELGLALHNYTDVFGDFPFEPSERRAIHEKLSWRVAVLPFIEQNALLERFDTKSAWDSAQNKPLAKQVPELFTFPNGSGVSWIRPETPPRHFRDIIDGTAFTACFLENPNADKQPWSKPAPLTVAEAVKLVQSLPDGKSLLCVSYDGAVHTLSNRADVATLKRFFTPNDGEALDYEKLRP